MPVTHGVASSSLVRTATREAEKLPFLVLNQQVAEACGRAKPFFQRQVVKKKRPYRPFQAVVRPNSFYCCNTIFRISIARENSIAAWPRVFLIRYLKLESHDYVSFHPKQEQDTEASEGHQPPRLLRPYNAPHHPHQDTCA